MHYLGGPFYAQYYWIPVQIKLLESTQMRAVPRHISVREARFAGAHQVLRQVDDRPVKRTVD